MCDNLGLFIFLTGLLCTQGSYILAWIEESFVCFHVKIITKNIQ